MTANNEVWMRPALVWLFDHASPEQLKGAVRQPAELALVRDALETSIAGTGTSSVPAGERGDNLIMALIALRLKFSREIAMEKLETNLALRRTE